MMGKTIIGKGGCFLRLPKGRGYPLPCGESELMFAYCCAIVRAEECNETRSF